MFNLDLDNLPRAVRAMKCQALASELGKLRAEGGFFAQKKTPPIGDFTADLRPDGLPVGTLVSR